MSSAEPCSSSLLALTSFLAISYCAWFYSGREVAREWSNNPRNFDNIGEAMVMIYEIMSTEAWVDAYSAMASAPSNIGDQPSSGGKIDGGAFLFVFVTLVVGNLLLLNLFVASVYDKYMTVKNDSKLGQMGLMTDSQLDFIESVRLLSHAIPKKVLPLHGHLVPVSFQ